MLIKGFRQTLDVVLLSEGDRRPSIPHCLCGRDHFLMCSLDLSHCWKAQNGIAIPTCIYQPLRPMWAYLRFSKRLCNAFKLSTHFFNLLIGAAIAPSRIGVIKMQVFPFFVTHKNILLFGLFIKGFGRSRVSHRGLHQFRHIRPIGVKTCVHPHPRTKRHIPA